MVVKHVARNITLKHSGRTGLQGDPGVGIATGGTNGQILRKASNDDYDTEWATASGTGDMLASTYDPQNIADDSFDRANHTGSQAISSVTGLQGAIDAKANTSHNHTASQVTDFDTEVGNNTDVAANTAARHTHSNKPVLDATTASFLTADETKLDGIAAGATANDTDANLKNRVNHTGSQAISTVTGLQVALDAKAVDSDVVHDTGNETVGGVKTFSSDPLIPDEVYDATAWNGSLEPPTKNAVRDKIESLVDEGTIDTIVAGNNIDVDATDPANPIVAVETLTSADVGLGNVNNTSDANKPVSTATQTALDTKQPLDSDLTTIAGLTPTTDNFLVSNADAWASRTPAQARTHMGLGTIAVEAEVNYALLAGRSGGQTLTGGTAGSNKLILRSTSNATKGSVELDEAGGKTTLILSSAGTNTGLTIGTDTNLYRSGANVLATDDQVLINSNTSGGNQLTIDNTNTAGRGELLFSEGAAVKGIFQYRGTTNGTIPNTFRFQSQTSTNTDILFGTNGGNHIFIAGGQNGLTTGRVGISTVVPAGGLLTIGTDTTTATGGLYLGTDTNLYRSAADTLKTDDNLIVGTPGTAAGSVSVTDGTQTLTNKRVTPRVSTTTSSATPTINTDSVDMYGLTAQTVDITSFTTNLSGTPTNGQKLWIYVVGTAARAITWGATFEAGPVALPSTTVTTQRLDVGFVWNSATSKWRAVASGSG